MQLYEAKNLVRWTIVRIAWLYLAVLIASIIIELTTLGRDSTDNPKAWTKRSNVTIVTDYATGCQYLKSSAGGLTPRLAKDGTQLSCESEVKK